jgi:hypothetical protein
MSSSQLTSPAAFHSLAVEVIALVIEYVDGWKTRSWLRRVCRRFEGAVVWLVENEVSRQISDDGLWTLTNIPRKNRQIMCSLAQFSGFLSQSIQGINLSCWGTFRDEDMMRLVRHFSLLEEECGIRCLNLSFCTMITQTSFKVLPMISRNLTSLSLIGCTQLTDHDMKSITTLTSLRELHVTGCYKIHKSDAFEIHMLENLTTLSISGTAIESFGFLRNFRRLETLNAANLLRLALPNSLEPQPVALKSLNLSRSLVNKEVLMALRTFPHLTELDLSNAIGENHDACMSVLGSCTKLQRLNLSGTFFPAAAVEQLKNMNNLIFLNLCWCRLITDASIDALSHLPLLETLVLTSCELLTDKAMASLAKLRNLRSVSIKGCNRISSGSVAGLEGLGIRVRVWD